MEKFISICCPNCNEYIIINKNELNCKIFRHGVYKHNYIQIDPHLNKNECDRLKKENLIYGCGKPFQIKEIENKLVSLKCDYI